MKCSIISLSSKFPEKFLQISIILQTIQEQLSKHQNNVVIFSDRDFCENLLKMAKAMSEMEAEFEKTRSKMSAQTRVDLRKQFSRLEKLCRGIVSVFLSIYLLKGDSSSQILFRMRINELMKFWNGSATNGIRCSVA